MGIIQGRRTSRNGKGKGKRRVQSTERRLTGRSKITITTIIMRPKKSSDRLEGHLERDLEVLAFGGGDAYARYGANAGTNCDFN